MQEPFEGISFNFTLFFIHRYFFYDVNNDVNDDDDDNEDVNTNL